LEDEDLGFSPPAAAGDGVTAGNTSLILKLTAELIDDTESVTARKNKVSIYSICSTMGAAMVWGRGVECWVSKHKSWV